MKKLWSWIEKLFKEEYILEVWFCKETIETDRGLKTTSHTSKKFVVRSFQKKTQKHIIAKLSNGDKLEIKTTKPFDYNITKVK